MRQNPSSVLLLMSAVTVLTAQAAQQGDFIYEDKGTSITITGYTGSSGAVVVPDTIAGKPVTAIGSNAFSGRTSLTSVVIPQSVTRGMGVLWVHWPDQREHSR